MSRLKLEGENTYFMRILALRKEQYPDLKPHELWYGVCDETDLPCLHPYDQREYQSDYFGTRLLKDFIASEPPGRMYDEEYRDRVLSLTRCPVCDTWDPKEPVDVRKKRMRGLGMALAIAMRRCGLTATKKNYVRTPNDTRMPRFRLWIWQWGITARLFGWLFQVKLIRDEIFSQRHDTRRIRLMGLSIKLFGRNR